MLSKRVQNIEESGIRKVFDLAAKNKGEYINLSIGQPHFKVSPQLKKLASEAICGDHNAYASTLGLPVLREKIARKFKEENNISAAADDIIITSGVSGAIFLLLASIINPGDEVILPDPYFVLYKEVLIFLEAKIISLDTYPDFHIDPEKLKKLVNKKTKAIIINSPNNPTGAVLSKVELEKIAQVAKDNQTLIISDEIYEKFDYDKKFFSIGSIYKNTVTLNGFSKSHAIPGWRMGYAYGPRKIISAMNKLQQYTFVCAPSFAQTALSAEEDFSFEKEYKDYKKKRDYVWDNLRDLYELNIPEGAFYAFIRIPNNKKDFIEDALKNKLLIVPGEVFSTKEGWFRISFAVDDELLTRGIEILKNLA